MDKQPIFVAQPVHRGMSIDYRGEVLDGNTYRTILVTAHTYANETIAKCAAKRMWAERQAVECAA